MALPTQIADRLRALGVPPDEVEERFIRGSGPGGQKINKTASTVQLRHLPTGVEVRIQRERSQLANRLEAWSELCRRLESRRQAGIDAERGRREAERRRTRQKSAGQKARMIAGKRHRARIKSARGRVRPDD